MKPMKLKILMQNAALWRLWLHCILWSKFMLRKERGLLNKRWDSRYFHPKGQIKSEWIYKIINFPKNDPKNLKDICPMYCKNSHGRNPSNFSGHFLEIDDFINSFWLNLTFMDLAKFLPSWNVFVAHRAWIIVNRKF